MSAEPASRRSPAPASSRSGLLLASACVALVPYLGHIGMFNRLYWFGDEFDLIDQMDRLGFWHWVWLVFAENFVPVFKVLWGGGVLLFGGSYAAMICAVWLLHALNVGLLGRLMRACDLSWTAVFLAQAAFGLASSNIETLAWSVQGSAVLSVTFMLLALLGFIEAPGRSSSYAWSAASALSFSRGVLTGLVLAFTSFFHGSPPDTGSGRRLARAAAYLAPSVIVALLILGLATGQPAAHGGPLGGGGCVWLVVLLPKPPVSSPGVRILGLENGGIPGAPQGGAGVVVAGAHRRAHALPFLHAGNAGPWKRRAPRDRAVPHGPAQRRVVALPVCGARLPRPPGGILVLAALRAGPRSGARALRPCSWFF